MVSCGRQRSRRCSRPNSSSTPVTWGTRTSSMTSWILPRLWQFRGNVDRGSWADGLSKRETAEAAGRFISCFTTLPSWTSSRCPRDIHVVISGHSHIVRAERRDGVLYLNPGSAGPRRFNLPVTVAATAGDGVHDRGGDRRAADLTLWQKSLLCMKFSAGHRL